MPELPEVETVKRGLTPYMKGVRIVQTIQNRPNLRIPFPENLAQKTQGLIISDMGRRGKYMLIHLEDAHTLIVHLGMSGSFKIVTHNEAYVPNKHDHLIFEMESKAKIIFNDPRRFGMVYHHPVAELEDHKAFSNMGPEPFDLEFNDAYLYSALKQKTSPIKTALLDQAIVAGLGNIYVCEALFMVGINPKRKSNKISKAKCAELVTAIRDVLSKAIVAGGSSLRDHRQASGELGYFQHQFSVYGKEGDKCPTCDCDYPKTHGIRRITQSGRSSFYCPQKQK